MVTVRIATALAVICACLAMTPRALAAEPIRVALVIGNANYATLPGIPACARSANAVSAALRALGFEVTERQDPSAGGIDAGIGEVSQRLTDGKGTAVVYICGYGARFNDRIFMLPVSARIPRPSDVLTQGVLIKSVLDTVGHGPLAGALIAIDMVPKPDSAPQLDLDGLGAMDLPDGTGLIAVTQPMPGDSPTLLASALVAHLAGPVVREEELLANVRTQLTDSKVTIAALRMPTRSAFLAGGGPPPAAEPTRPLPSPQPPPAQSAAEQLIPSAQPPLPDEYQMNEADRRRMQTALARIGYYALPVDGRIGPETRAAIRRYQHEIGAEVTGQLTASQSIKLLGTR